MNYKNVLQFENNFPKMRILFEYLVLLFILVDNYCGKSLFKKILYSLYQVVIFCSLFSHV